MTGADDGRLSKTGTAARHTYDVGYSKWDAFDVEAALQEVDRCDFQRSCRVSKVEMKADDGIDRSADPKDMLDAAISKLKAQEVQEPELEEKEDAKDLSISLADAGDTTGHQLAAEYQKWEDFDDFDDLDDGDMDYVDSSGMDLNALTGPAEEVKQIQAHWRREAKKMTKSSKAAARGATATGATGAQVGPKMVIDIFEMRC